MIARTGLPSPPGRPGDGDAPGGMPFELGVGSAEGLADVDEGLGEGLALD